MNYVGKRVFHRAKFGEGVIIAQDQDNHITVRFDSLSETKSFIAPVCFTCTPFQLKIILYFRFSNICCLHQRGNDSERLRSLRCDILSMLRQSPIFSTHF